MKLTVQVKLLPTGEQSASLKTTMETANAAADRLSELAWNAGEFRRFPMHKLGSCKVCGYTTNADFNGAGNIRLKGLTMLGAGASNTHTRSDPGNRAGTITSAIPAL